MSAITFSASFVRLARPGLPTKPSSARCARSLLALMHKQGPGAMGHEDALLLHCLFDRHKPHRWPLHGLTDRFGIECVALAALGMALT